MTTLLAAVAPPALPLVVGVSVCVCIPRYRIDKDQPGYSTLASYFLNREPHLVHSLTRNFWWFENTLWAEDLHHLADNNEVRGLCDAHSLCPIYTYIYKAWW